MTDYIQVVTTVESREAADVVAKSMVEKRLVACAQITGPVKSTYRWKGHIEVAEEWVLIMKTRKDLYMELEKSIKAIHGYDEPEILAIPVTAGSRGYLEWVARETGDGT